MMRLRVTLILPFLALIASCASEPGEPVTEPDQIATAVRQAEIPANLMAGKTAFDANCATCHGDRALGTDRGPPLVHIIYEPSHHADIAFVFAVERGVRAHHWNYGDMPPVPSVSREEVEAITAYVRYLQRVVGIT